MRTHRLSIGLMMAAIAVLALDLWLFRVYRGPDLAAMFGPIGLASQAGLVLAMRGPAARRPFWFGFMAGGVGALIGSAWLGLARPGPVVDLWVAYLAALDSQFGRLPRLGAGNPGHEFLDFAVVAGFFFPGQLLLASVSGILASALGCRGIRRRGRVTSGRTASPHPELAFPRDGRIPAAGAGGRGATAMREE